MFLKIKAETTVDSEPCAAAWDGVGKLYVGTEDGSIKTFDANLSAGASWSAHDQQLFALAAAGGNVYSSSNDGKVKVWSDKGEKLAQMESAGGDVGVLRVFGDDLYAGDEGGNVVIYENNVEKARYNVLEEVKDLWLSPPFLFTVRDLDVTVTEIKPDESKTRFVTRHTMEGRAPVRVGGNRLLVMARDGNHLQLLDATGETSFKKLHAVKASDMIVTSLALSGDFAWTAGWDGAARRWRLAGAGDQLEPAGEVHLGSCVNALVASSPEIAYAVLAGGRVVCISAT